MFPPASAPQQSRLCILPQRRICPSLPVFSRQEPHATLTTPPLEDAATPSEAQELPTDYYPAGCLPPVFAIIVILTVVERESYNIKHSRVALVHGLGLYHQRQPSLSQDRPRRKTCEEGSSNTEIKRKKRTRTNNTQTNTKQREGEMHVCICPCSRPLSTRLVVRPSSTAPSPLCTGSSH